MNYATILQTFTGLDGEEKNKKLLDLVILLAPHNKKLQEVMPLIESHSLAEQQIDDLYTKLINILAWLQEEQLADANDHISTLHEQLRAIHEAEKVAHAKDEADADALIQSL